MYNFLAEMREQNIVLRDTDLFVWGYNIYHVLVDLHLSINLCLPDFLHAPWLTVEHDGEIVQR